MDTITLTINNRKVVAKPGMTVLEAAQQAGIYIPTLCYHKDLFPEGHCRVCLVDIKGQRSLQPACMFPVADGMEVNTHSHAVRDARRLVVELLLSNHPNECLTCVRSRNCELQALAKEMGMPHGSLVTGKMVAGLRELGFNRVFDTDFTADLTIIEEGNELIKRINEGGELPLITSCCPGWIKFAEHFYPDLLDNLSTCKSPQQMFGAVAKTYYAEKAGVNPAKMVVVSIMPCIAKKFECERPEMNSSGYKDVDLVLTTRELGQMLREAGTDLTQLPEENYDDPLGTSTGASVIFGATGGVMEAALRTAYEVITGETLGTLDFESVRGLAGVKEATIPVGELQVKVAVAHGLSNARKVLDMIRRGEGDYHFIEVMACPGGCLAGGGQPIPVSDEIRTKRMGAIYRADRELPIRKSHENPMITVIYEEFLKEPLGHRSHELLHTHYTPRPANGMQRGQEPQGNETIPAEATAVKAAGGQ